MTTSPSVPAAAIPRPGKKQRTRERIQEVALRAFREQGYEVTTAEQIAQEAGISRSNFYLHFKSKAEVVVSAMSALDPEVVAMYGALDAVGTSGPDIRAWVIETAKLWDRDLQRFETIERALAVEPLVSARYMETLQHAADAMPRYLSRSEDDPGRDRARMRLISMMCAFDRSMYFTVVRDSGLDRGEMIEALADQWCSLLAA